MIGSAVGAVVGSGASKSAAKTQAKAADQAAAEQLQAAQIAANTSLSIYGSTKASLAPYTQTGTAALNQLSLLYGLPVYNTPTDASQTPVVSGVNDGTQLLSGGTGGSSGSAFGSSMPSPGSGYTLSAPTAQAQIDFLKTNTQQEGRTDTAAAINKYLAANPNATPEQQLAYIQGSILPDHNKVSADYNSWLQSAGTWNAPAATTGGAPTGAPGNGQPTAPNYTAMLNALTQTPGYQFGLQQGGAALDRSAASQGLLLSGAQLQASQEFGTNYAIQQGWNPYVSQLNALSGIGESAAAGVGNAGTAAAGQIGTAITGGAAAAGSAQLAAAQATAAGTIGSANAITGGLNNALNNSLQALVFAGA